MPRIGETPLKPYWKTRDGSLRLYHGDVLSVLRRLPAKSVHMAMTSPPYWGLRDYGADGQIGSENTPDEFVAKMVEVFAEVYRVLRDDGTCWINLGDSYSVTHTGKSSGNPSENFNDVGDRFRRGVLAQRRERGLAGGLKSGNLVGIPWRVALALQAWGWVLRQDIIWHKPSPMPECLDPSTQVFIRVNGWVSRTTLERVFNMPQKPEILGPNGWVNILNVWKTSKPAMVLEVGRIERVICSPDHRFPVSHDRDNLRTENLPASDIRAVGYRDYLLYCPVQKFLSPVLKEWEGVGLTGHLGYVLGLYAAEGSQDGGYRMKWTIHKEEDYIKAKFFKSLRSLGLVGEAFPDPDCNAQNLIAVSDWLQRTIWTFVFGKDARTKRLNIELLLNSPEEFRRRFLEGYIDGDGSDRGDGWGAASASRGLRDDLSTLASSLGVVTSKGYSKSRIKGYDKEYHSHGIWTPYFNRSTKKGTDGVFQVLPRGRKMLDEEREMIDLEVEGRVFLIGDGLVTHNSVKNRCTKAHEYVFLLTKSMKYFYDAEGVKEIADTANLPPRTLGVKQAKTEFDGMISHNEDHARAVLDRVPARNKRDVWTLDDERRLLDWLAENEPETAKRFFEEAGNKGDTWRISSQGYEGAHFATFPIKLVEPCILAGTSEYGCCASCGAPWKRVIEEKQLKRERPNDYVKRTGEEGTGNSCSNSVAGVEVVTLGWEPTCSCEGGIKPCTVLDPFIGSATTLEVCIATGRHGVGIDLSEKYLRDNAVPRLEGALLSRPASSHLIDREVEAVELGEPSSDELPSSLDPV